MVYTSDKDECASFCKLQNSNGCCYLSANVCSWRKGAHAVNDVGQTSGRPTATAMDCTIKSQYQ